MSIVDKSGLLDRLHSTGNISLELGCGHRKRHPEAIGIDQQDFPGVDIVGDSLDVLRRFPEASVSAVFSYHFFEHIDDVESHMVELNRIMRGGATLLVVTPHFSNPYYYSDPTHRTPFGLYSFSYFCKNDFFRRKVPRYHSGYAFKLDSVDLIFKSSPPFYFRWGIKKIFQSVFTFNRYMMELYEENFCYVVPCYEVRYSLTRHPDQGEL
ncbi:MAG: methyltransferase type 11 [Deltaproteobacteria bacterium]|nr:MAG: methyltransferase type 11 [Deltaproteobacteria bacterium]